MGEYAHKVDVFSCGVVLYQLLTGTTPFSNETLLDQFHQILHEDVNMAIFPVSLLSPEVRALMELMFTKASPQGVIPACPQCLGPWATKDG